MGMVTNGATISDKKTGSGKAPEVLVERPAFEEIILTAAEQLIMSQGYANTSLADIGHRIGVSRSAIYYYFKDKQEILGRLVERLSTQTAKLQARLEQATDTDPGDKLVAMVKVLTLHVLSGGSLHLLQEGNPIGRNKAQFQQAVKAQRSILKGFQSVVAAGVADGSFRAVDPSIFAFSLIGMVNWAARWFKEDGRLNREQLAACFADYALHAVLASGKPSPKRARVETSISSIRAELDKLERMFRTER